MEFIAQTQATMPATDDFMDLRKFCFDQPSSLNIGVAFFLMCGSTLSYIPQYISLIKSKSSEGLSFITLGMSLVGAFLLFINSCILRWPYITCCFVLSFGECLENNLASEQLLVGLVCVLILYILFMVYCVKDKNFFFGNWTTYQTSMYLFVGVNVFSLFLSLVGMVLYYKLHFQSTTLILYAQTLGTISAILMIIQWTPQIYTTWQLGHEGSLSMVMLWLQMPGNLLVIFFQGILNRSDVSTWAPYFFQFIQQIVLLAMCYFFKLKRAVASDGSELSLLTNGLEESDVFGLEQ